MDTCYFVKRERVVYWLKHIAELDSKIRYLESRISDVRSRLIQIGYDPSSQGRSGSANAIPDGIATLADLESEWSERVDKTLEEVERVRELCSPANLGRYVVWLREVEGMKWNEIARKLSYSVAQLHRFYEGGIRDLHEFVPEQIKYDVFPNAAP